MLDRQMLTLPAQPNEVWSMDFVMDSLANDNRNKCLTVVDDFSRECLESAVEFDISGEHVSRVFGQIAQFRGLPKAIRIDQGPEFTSRALDRWTYRQGVDLTLIATGKPTQNAYIASFGMFRDESLNDYSLVHARAVITAWRHDYNEARPHSSIGRMPPAEFALRHRSQTRHDATQEIV
jgi:putative transposase